MGWRGRRALARDPACAQMLRRGKANEFARPGRNDVCRRTATLLLERLWRRQRPESGAGVTVLRSEAFAVAKALAGQAGPAGKVNRSPDPSVSRVCCKAARVVTGHVTGRASVKARLCWVVTVSRVWTPEEAHAMRSAVGNGPSPGRLANRRLFSGKLSEQCGTNAFLNTIHERESRQTQRHSRQPLDFIPARNQGRRLHHPRRRLDEQPPF